MLCWRCKYSFFFIYLFLFKLLSSFIDSLSITFKVWKESLDLIMFSNKVSRAAVIKLDDATKQERFNRPAAVQVMVITATARSWVSSWAWAVTTTKLFQRHDNVYKISKFYTLAWFRNVRSGMESARRRS